MRSALRQKVCMGVASGSNVPSVQTQMDQQWPFLHLRGQSQALRLRSAAEGIPSAMMGCSPLSLDLIDLHHPALQMVSLQAHLLKLAFLLC